MNACIKKRFLYLNVDSLPVPGCLFVSVFRFPVSGSVRLLTRILVCCHRSNHLSS